MAATTRGCECPTLVTAMPAVKSRKRLRSMSSIIAPRPPDHQRIDACIGWRHDAVVTLEPRRAPWARKRAENARNVAMKWDHNVGTPFVERNGFPS